MNDKMRSLFASFTDWFKEKLLFFILIVCLIALAVISLAYAYRFAKNAYPSQTQASEIALPALRPQEKLSELSGSQKSSEGSVVEQPSLLTRDVQACEKSPNSQAGCEKSSEMRPAEMQYACKAIVGATKKLKVNSISTCD
jgi:hypothetical protein